MHRSRKPEWVYAHRGFESHPLRHKNFELRIADFEFKRREGVGGLIPQSEIRNPKFFRRGARVAELAALEMLCTGNRTVGSNPTLSATRISNFELRVSELGANTHSELS